MRTVTVQDSTTSAGLIGEAFTIEVPDRFTLRELIRLRVRDEVARYNASTSGRYAGLACAMEFDAKGSPPDPGAVKARVDWERQADVAIAAFLRNGFFVLVGDEQLEDLDAVVDLDVDTDVCFIRLLGLAGG